MAIFIQNRQEFEQQLVIMKTQEGWSIRALAGHFAVSRNMVRRILRKHEKLRDQGHDILLRIARFKRGNAQASSTPTRKGFSGFWRNTLALPDSGSLKNCATPVMTAASVFSGIGFGVSGPPRRKHPLSGSRQGQVFKDKWTGVLTPSSS
jgi:hypothetical protein